MITKRLITKCAPDHECSDEEINAIIRESTAIHKDPDIMRWSSPTEEEMIHINALADEYKAQGGEGYWAEITIPFSEYLEGSETESYMYEYNRIRKDSFDRGIYLSLYSPTPESLKEILFQTSSNDDGKIDKI